MPLSPGDIAHYTHVGGGRTLTLNRIDVIIASIDTDAGTAIVNRRKMDGRKGRLETISLYQLRGVKEESGVTQFVNAVVANQALLP